MGSFSEKDVIFSAQNALSTRTTYISEGLLKLHFFDAEVDLVGVCFNENFEDVYEALVLVKKGGHLRNRGQTEKSTE